MYSFSPLLKPSRGFHSCHFFTHPPSPVSVSALVNTDGVQNRIWHHLTLSPPAVYLTRSHTENQKIFVTMMMTMMMVMMMVMMVMMSSSSGPVWSARRSSRSPASPSSIHRHHSTKLCRLCNCYHNDCRRPQEPNGKTYI